MTVDGFGDKRAGHGDHRLLDELLQPSQRADRGAGVQRADAAGMAGAPRLDQVERLAAAHLADGDAIRAKAQRRADEVRSGRPRRPWCAGPPGWARRTAARGCPRSAPRGRRSWHLRQQCVDQRGLARRGAARDQDVGAARDGLAQELGLALRHDPCRNIVAEREHRDGRPPDRERRAGHHRRQQAFELLPVPGSSAETRGDPGWTSAPTWCATRRMMRSPSSADRRSPVSSSPPASRSIQSRPSGLSMTSPTLASSSQPPIAGPNAVRSIRAPRAWASGRKAVTVTGYPVLGAGHGADGRRGGYKAPGCGLLNKPRRA